jgi:flavin-dependent dehydrogenase
MFYENIIIGAGPAGLQAAYFFKKYNINYLVIEKNELCGSFLINIRILVNLFL